MIESSRTERKRQRTREALISATRRLVLGHHTGKLSIQDITEAADVGLGTFYNYFENKGQIFEAVLQEIEDQFQADLHEVRKHLKDPAMIVAVTLKFSFEQAQDHTDWHTFLRFRDRLGVQFLHQDPEQCLTDIQRGAQGGRFRIDDAFFARNLILGMVEHANMEIYLGRLGRSAIEETTRYILRMLGLPDVVAKALAQGHLPTVAAPKRQAEQIQSSETLTSQGLSARSTP